MSVNSSDGGWPVADETLSGNMMNSLGGAGGTIGTTSLQQSIDQLTQAVERMVGSLGSAAAGGTASSSSGTAPIPVRTFSGMGVSPAASFSSSGAGGGSGTGGGGPTFMGMTLGPGGPSQGGQGFGGSNRGPVGTALSIAGSLGASYAAPGITMNKYAAMSQMMSPAGTSYNKASNFTFAQAYGVNNTSLSAISSGWKDAGQGAQQLQYLSGNYGTTGIRSSSLGNAAWGATAAMGIANPGMSLSQSASMAQQMYSPMMSMNMMKMGYGVTPRLENGGTNSSAAVAMSLMRGSWGGSIPNQSQFNKGMSQYGHANINMQSLGYNTSAMMPELAMYRKLFSQGLDSSQAQKLVTQAASKGPQQAGAEARLNSLGIQNTDIQKMKNEQAQTTSRYADVNQGFNAGLTAATGSLEKFNAALNAIINGTGMAGPLGNLAGAGSAFGGLANAAGGGLVQGMIMKRMLGNSLVAGGIDGTGADVAGAGMAGGGMLAGMAPLLAALAVPAVLSSIHHKNGKNWMQQGPGGPHSFWNSYSQAGKDINRWTGYDALTSGWGQLMTSHMSKGGKLGGYGGGDQHPALLESGETVVDKDTSRALAPIFKAAGVPGYAKGGKVTGDEIVKYAESFIGKVPYVTGGASPSGWDCSGFTSYIYEHFGLQKSRGTSESLYGWAKKTSKPVVGGLVFERGDGTYPPPGHIGIYAGNGRIVDAPGTGLGTRMDRVSDVMGYGVPPKGFVGSSSPGPGGGGGNPTAAQGSGGQSTSGGYSGSLGGGATSGIGYSESSLASNAGESASLGGGAGGLGGSSLETFGKSSGGNAGTGASGGHAGQSGSFPKGTGGNAAQNKALMRKLASRYGWGSGAQWNALNTLEMHEAGYNNHAQNPGSTAYGIGQFLDQTWAGYGAKTSNPRLQEEYMLEYIKSKYGSPGKAWAQYYDHPGGVGWYSGGGRPGGGSYGIVGERGPELVNFGQGGSVMSNAQTMQMMKAVSAQPNQTAWSTMNAQQGGQMINLANPLSNGQPQVNMNFSKGAISFGNITSKADAENYGQQFADSVVKALEGENLMKTIRKGELL